MAGLTIPLKSTSGSSSTLPQVMNNGAFYQTSYPKQGFTGYNAAPASPSAYTQATVANFTKTIANHTVLETVGSTAINTYMRNLVDVFQALGNFYTNADYGTQTEFTTGWSGFAYNGWTTGTYTFSDTVRIASLERLVAGKTVGATIAYTPAFKCVITGPNQNATFSSLVMTAVFKLMNTSGTLTTIGTMTSVAPASTVGQNTTMYQFAAFQQSTFTPVTSSLGDRIIIEITITGSVQSTTGTGGSNGVTTVSL